MREDPREVACRALVRVEHDDAYANLLLPRMISKAGLDGRDANLTTELVYGTLRWQRLLDAILARAARRDPATLDPEVRAVLRMGTQELLHLRVPPHAAVDTAVRTIKRMAPRASGLVNAALRRVSERSEEAWLRALREGLDEDAFRALRTSHPGWIVRAFAAALRADGREGELDALLDADNVSPAVHLVCLPGLATRDPERALRFSPYGMSAGHGEARELLTRTGIRAQDEGSQLVAAALAAAAPIRPGERWLDVCAGPGGKTALLAAIAGSRATVLANEPNARRAGLVRRAVSAFDVPVEELDGAEFLAAHAGRADRILLDAPCSGLGSLRRRPEARWRKRPGEVRELARLQHRLLTAAAVALRPGAILAYTTCSPHPAETVDQVGTALDEHPELELLPAGEALRAVAPEVPLGQNTAGVQLWPQVHGTDGMFLALFRRR